MIRRLAIVVATAGLIATACSETARLESESTVDAASSATTSVDEAATDVAGDADDPAESQDESGDDEESTDGDVTAVETGSAATTSEASNGDSDDTDPNDSDPADEDPDGADDDQVDNNEDADGELAGSLSGPGSATAASAERLTPVGDGDSGDEVLALQNRLAELGFAPGSPDGDYGHRTIKAVTAFQELVDLPATGNADAKTLNALLRYRYDGLILRAGDEGNDVESLQLKLSKGPFDPGPIDGDYGTGTVQAVWALEKMAGIPVDGDWGPLDEDAWSRLVDGTVGNPEMDHDQRWVEVDLSEQIMKVYDPGERTPTLVSHASSGSGIPWENEDHSGSSVTPLGDFHIDRRINGWRESSLNIGRLYNPLYFNGGIAFHGATSVPLYPASHGCIRLPMHIADYLPAELPNGTPVHILA